jgi:hypothetical protein
LEFSPSSLISHLFISNLFSLSSTRAALPNLPTNILTCYPSFYQRSTELHQRKKDPIHIQAPILTGSAKNPYPIFFNLVPGPKT